MAINVERQRAFSAAFNQYPDLLFEFTSKHVSLASPGGGDLIVTTDQPQIHMMELLMAQFITRLFQTRARNSDSELMKEFAAATIRRYHDMTTKKIGGLYMKADAKYQRALNHVESGMATAIFSALMHEAQIDDVANENGKKNDFDEADFWHDIMLALGSYYNKTRHPRWWMVTQTMFLDHKEEFRKAIEDENREADKSKSADNSGGPSAALRQDGDG